MTVSLDILGALGITRGEMVALVGGGGKTTLMKRLVAAARARDWRVLATTTTNMEAPPQAARAGWVFADEHADPAAALARCLDQRGTAQLVAHEPRPGKAKGLEPAALVKLIAGLDPDLVVIEADGSRGRSLKLPAHYEPQVPETTDLTVHIVGLDILGAPLDAEHVHRLELVREVLRKEIPEATVSSEDVATLLNDPRGYAPRLPAGSRRLLLLNKADRAAPEAPAALASRIDRRAYPEILASALIPEPVRIWTL